MRVYVTGGGLGFTGGHVARVLRERGAEVRDEYVDVLDAAGLERAMEGCDAVVHVAALYSYDRRDEAALARVNIEGTRTVLAAAARAGIARVVHTSTAGTCGPTGVAATGERVREILGVSGVVSNAFLGSRGITNQISAGKSHELQFVLGKHITHSGGAAKLDDGIGPQLNPMKTHGGDIFYGLAIVAAPGDGSITEMDFGRGGCDGRIEMREVHRGIKQFSCEKGLIGKCGAGGQCADCPKEFASR